MKTGKNDRTDVQKALKWVAMQRGKTVAEIRAEITEAINVAWESGSQSVTLQQQCVPCRGSKPTPEELLTYLIQKLDDDTHSNPFLQ